MRSLPGLPSTRGRAGRRLRARDGKRALAQVIRGRLERREGRRSATSNPAARLGNGADRRYARGTDNALWHRWRERLERLGETRWRAHIEPCGLPGDQGDGRLVRGTDSALWHKWCDGGWSDWEALGGEQHETGGLRLGTWANRRLHTRDRQRALAQVVEGGGEIGRDSAKSYHGRAAPARPGTTGRRWGNGNARGINVEDEGQKEPDRREHGPDPAAATGGKRGAQRRAGTRRH